MKETENEATTLSLQILSLIDGKSEKVIMDVVLNLLGNIFFNLEYQDFTIVFFDFVQNLNRLAEFRIQERVSHEDIDTLLDTLEYINTHNFSTQKSH